MALVSRAFVYYNWAMENNTIEGAESVSPVPKKPVGSFWDGLGDFARFASIVIIVVVVVRVFIAQPFIVSGTSMVPTFQNSNYLIVDELSYHFEQPHRGDVIVFHPPIAGQTQEYYIKRVIGIPGDTVNVKNGVVTITNAAHPQGMILSEPYITADNLEEDVTTVVPAGSYFAMGDNRPASYDSRRWGLLPAKNITGRVLLRLFPANELGVFPGAFTNYTS